jgi:hypothetical protein
MGRSHRVANGAAALCHALKWWKGKHILNIFLISC